MKQSSGNEKRKSKNKIFQLKISLSTSCENASKLAYLPPKSRLLTIAQFSAHENSEFSLRFANGKLSHFILAAKREYIKIPNSKLKISTNIPLHRPMSLSGGRFKAVNKSTILKLSLFLIINQKNNRFFSIFARLCDIIRKNIITL